MKTEEQEIAKQQILQQELHLDNHEAVAARAEKHPLDEMLRQDRLPHIWCSGCGLGIAMNCFCLALQRAGLDLDKVCVVSGIGCTGRVAGYVRLDSFHTTHGRAIPFATGLKLANPELKVVVFSGDGDLVTIGGNHFIHAARRNVDMTVICVNNFNYGMTGGQVGATTPIDGITTTTPYGNYEFPLNIPFLAAASGAVYVARWTVLQARQLEWSMTEALRKPGFSLVEVISPCPTSFGRQHKQRLGLDTMRYYRTKSTIAPNPDVHQAGIELGGDIVVGKFVDVDKPTYLQLLAAKMQKIARASHA